MTNDTSVNGDRRGMPPAAGHQPPDLDLESDLDLDLELGRGDGLGGHDRLPDALGQPLPAGGWPDSLQDEPAGHDPAVALRRDVEAILLVADTPITVAELARILGHPSGALEDLLVELAAAYARDVRGFVLRAVAGGWRLYTHPAAHPAVDAYLRDGTQARLTQAALETLAVVAYRQPVARAHIAAVRGVSVDGVLRTLTNRGLVAVVGHDDGPGQAALYGTTPRFLEQLGINTLAELPPVGDFLPDGVDLSELEGPW